MQTAHSQVRAHWEDETCGIRNSDASDAKTRALEIKEARYKLVPEIPGFVNFSRAKGKKVLEIGVGAGTDFSQWVEAGADAYGVDLTEAAIRYTREHLDALGLPLPADHLKVDDAENLSFPSNNFDFVYSWGVLHHSPNTEVAFQQAFRVLKPGGTFVGMIYHLWSWTTLFYWARFALLKGKPFQSPREMVSRHMESPYTRVYSVSEMHDLLKSCGFTNAHVEPRIMQGDLFDFKLSERRDNLLNRTAHKLFPRWLIRACGHRFGGMLMISATKP